MGEKEGFIRKIDSLVVGKQIRLTVLPQGTKFRLLGNVLVLELSNFDYTSNSSCIINTWSIPQKMNFLTLGSLLIRVSSHEIELTVKRYSELEENPIDLDLTHAVVVEMSKTPSLFLIFSGNTVFGIVEQLVVEMIND